MAPRLSDLERVEIDALPTLRAWLRADHARRDSVRIVRRRRRVEGHVSCGEVVDAAPSFGWIDSLSRKLDAERSMPLLSPRKPGSAWSAIDKARVARFAEVGLMEPPGVAAVEAARADGSWTFLDAVDRLEVPDDLAARTAETARLAERRLSANHPRNRSRQAVYGAREGHA